VLLTTVMVVEAMRYMPRLLLLVHVLSETVLDVEEFNRWCDQRSKPRNADSRVEYVIEVIKRRAG